MPLYRAEAPSELSLGCSRTPPVAPSHPESKAEQSKEIPCSQKSKIAPVWSLKFGKLGVGRAVTHCHPSSQETETGSSQFETSLSYTCRPRLMGSEGSRGEGVAELCINLGWKCCTQLAFDRIITKEEWQAGMHAVENQESWGRGSSGCLFIA